MSAKDLRRQYQEAGEKFQADITASSIYLDAPDEHGFWWKVTMPIEEYDARKAQVRALRRAAEKAEEDEEMELALEQFLHEAE